MSDDESELALLRMAALQTLKTVNENKGADIGKQHPAGNVPYNQKHPLAWRKFQGRGPTRNGGFNGRKTRNISNTNLISIPTMESHMNDSSDAINNKQNTNSVILKLDLPQNRYCNNKSYKIEMDNDNTKFSKFSRYDKSDSDSENSETEISDVEEKLVKSNSLDDLVKELEFEISGDKVSKKPSTVTHKKVKVKRVRQLDNSLDSSFNDSSSQISEKDVFTALQVKDEKLDDSVDLFDNCLEDKIIEDAELQEEIAPEVKPTVPAVLSPASSILENVTEQTDMIKNSIDHQVIKSPHRQALLPKPRGFNPHPRYEYTRQEAAGPHQKKLAFRHYENQQYVPTPIHTSHVHSHSNFSVPQPQLPSVQPQIINSRYDYSLHPPVPVPVPIPVQVPPRSLSPLSLSQESIGSIIMAPLSPRSAAFVIQNREIIEKRKRSPKHSRSRSRSRSLSPRVRRSKSPRRRSPSPRRLPRSASPKRSSSPFKKGRSPFKRSPSDRSPKRDIKERLTLNPKRNYVDSDSNTSKTRWAALDKDNKDKAAACNDEKDRDKDSVLQARRKKFEQQNTVNKDGIIRIKQNEEEQSEVDDSLSQKKLKIDPLPSEIHDSSSDFENDDAQDADDTLETNIDDLFSDEESEDENEGRFKSSNRSEANKTVAALKFNCLTKVSDIKNEALDDLNRNRDRTRRVDSRRNDRGRDHRNRDRDVLKKRRSPLLEKKSRIVKKDEKKETRRDVDVRRPRDSKRNEDRKQSVKTRVNVASKKSKEKDDRSDKTRLGSEKSEVKVRSVKERVAEVVNGSATPAMVADVKSRIKDKDKERFIASRKVAIAVDVKENKEYKPKDEVTVIEDDDEQDVIKKNEAGDLRAQLSRKRAERQSQKPSVKGADVQCRLLHNALGAVFNKAKKLKRSEDEAAPKDKKSIHQRLGLNEEPSIKKQKRKRSSGEQV